MKTFSLLLLALLAFFTLARADDKPELFGGDGGTVGVAAGDQLLLSLTPSIADAGWNFTSAKWRPFAAQGPNGPFAFDVGDKMTGTLQVATKDSGVNATWNFTATQSVEFESLILAAEFPLPQLVGGQWTADSSTGTFSAHFGGPHVFIGKVSSLDLAFLSKREVKFTFTTPTLVVLQDNRQWGSSTYTLRVGRGDGKMNAGDTFAVTMSVTTPDGLIYSRDLPGFMKPVTLAADDKWVPLKEDDLDIVPGSALDLSAMGFTDGPCGAKGRMLATPDGHFACANEPAKPRRFYGVNLCFEISYLPKDQDDRLLDRLVRLGYNAVRIHHYEAQMTTPKWQPNLDWDPVKVDELDYLMAGCTKRGIWITTDLFVSRPVSGKAIGLPQYDAAPDNRIPMETYKTLIPVSDAAYQNWQAFARKFLDRVNPYTGVRVADDPTVAWISLVNEGPVSNNWGAVRTMPEWATAWNKWLAARYTSRDALASALGYLEANEDLQKGNIAMPQYLDASTPRGRVAEVFVAETEKATYEKMRTFLRDDLKCQALLTNMNNMGPQVMPLAGVRDDYDYVDNHFYVDHPRFLQKAWHLPSFCSNANPVAAGAPGGTAEATTRLWGKPFTLTEFDYAGPSRYRAMGMPLTGAMAALQDWDALWHFDYGANSSLLFTPGQMSYFDLVSDPLMQAADRLGVLLFLRGDVSPATTRTAMPLPASLLANPDEHASLSPLQSLVWKNAVGGYIQKDSAPMPGKYQAISTPADDSETDAPGPIQSETGEIAIDPVNVVLTIDTPRSAGGFANVGKTIDAVKSGVHIDDVTTSATIFVNSLDGAPIKSSKRLLVTHLTDLQNTGAHFGEGARQTLEEWGGLPHLVLDGAATVHIALDDPSAYTVWTLATSGKRLEKVDAKVDAGQLVFTASVRGADGARMLYEIAR